MQPEDPLFLKLILMNYVALMGLSTLLAFVLHCSLKNRFSKLALSFWLTIIGGFIAQGVAGNEPFLAALAVLFTVPSSFILMQMMETVFEIKYKKNIYWFFVGCCVSLASIAYVNGFSFSIYSGLICIGVAAPVTLFIVQTLRIKRKKSAIQILFLVAAFSSTTHMYDYPFLRLNPDLQLVGFLIAFWNGFFNAIITPLLTIDTLHLAFKEKLEREISLTSSDLREKNMRLAKAERDKTHLLRVLCHDISNLLTVAHFSTEALIRKTLGKSPTAHNLVKAEEDDETHSLKHLRKISHAINSQNELITNIRTFLSIDTGKISVQVTPVDLREAVAETLLLIQKKADSKSISIQTDDLKAVKVQAEKLTLVNCVINNLLSNAIKFSHPKSEITLSTREDTDQGVVTFEVRDRGVGMDSLKLNSIFSETDPTTSKGTDGESGTGFGMPIVRYITEKIGAKVEIESTLESGNGDNHGTTVRVYFKKAA
jgi:signal transduction histidine kinase